MEPVLKRILTLDDDSVVTVTIHLPTLDSDGQDFECLSIIDGLSSPVRMKIFGTDAIQAFMLTMQLVGTCLEESKEFKAGRLKWLGEGDLGFPSGSLKTLL